MAASAPRTLERIRPEGNMGLQNTEMYVCITSPSNNERIDKCPVSVYPLDGHFSRCGVFRSSPAKLHPPLKERGELSQTDPMHNIYVPVLFSLGSVLTVIAVVVNQNDLFDQVRRAFLQDTEQTEKKYRKTHRGK